MLFRSFAMTLAVSTVANFAAAAPASATPSGVDGPRALALAYGYVRFFHPTNAASAVDWNSWLLHAVDAVKDADSPEEIRSALEAELAPLTVGTALTVGEAPASEALCLFPMEPYVFNQHVGVGLPDTPYPPEDHLYLSKRVYAANGASRNPLFDTTPACGTTVVKDLGAGISLRLPLAIPLRLDQTQAPLFGMPALEQFDTETANLADVIATWSILQHFYPYFDVVAVDWGAALDQALAEAKVATSIDEQQHVLRRMIARLGDGHGYVYRQDGGAGAQGGLPIMVDLVEGGVTVTKSLSAQLHAGDVITAIDGLDALDVLTGMKAEVSGSDQWKTKRALLNFGGGAFGTTAHLTVRRGEQTLALDLPRTSGFVDNEFGHEDFFEAAPGIFYVNLDKLDMEHIDARMAELAAARGIVFDMRGYSAGNEQVLAHLTDHPLRSAYFNIPQTVYPDHMPAPTYDTGDETRWLLEPLAPRFHGRAVFLTGGRAISYAESIMGIVEAYELGDIIASTPTAGANGNVNIITTPSGFRIHFTGTQVVKHDGSVHHLRGIQPTIVVQRTLAGVKAARDELLDAAVGVIEAN
jgi:C-terminal processing protease CtpA/Prc